jgi:pimeloyl-ACP methyl ester carboxylesterase
MQTGGYTVISRRSLIQTAAAAAAVAATPVAAQADNNTQETAPNLFIEANGIRYAYRRFGASTGVPLLFLIHFRATMDVWDPAVVNPLAKDRPVILFSNAGVGLSGGESPKTFEGMAANIEAFLDALKLTTVDLLGLSIGGCIAQQVALDRPSLVRRLILVGTGPRGGEEIVPRPEVRALLQKGGGPSVIFPALFFTQSEAGHAAAQGYLERIALRKAEREPPTKPETGQAQAAALFAWGIVPESNRYDYLAAIKQPTLVVNGSNDILIKTINSYILAQHLPNAKLVIYPDAGHGSLYQYHDDFVGEASRFLKA